MKLCVMIYNCVRKPCVQYFINSNFSPVERNFKLPLCLIRIYIHVPSKYFTDTTCISLTAGYYQISCRTLSETETGT